MDGQMYFDFWMTWLSGVSFGIALSALAFSIAELVKRGRASNARGKDDGKSIGETPRAAVTSGEEPTAAEPVAIPSADCLPKIGASGMEWAWGKAKYRRGDVVVVPQGEIDSLREPVFVLGDLHGDAASLRGILAHVFAASPRARVVFLGDLVDRATGPSMLECARLFLWAARDNPGRFLWIRGNHDFFARNAATGRFCTSVEPHEFADFLNGNPGLAAEGEALGDIMSSLPVGALLGNVWLSHGGVLQDDEAGVRTFAGFASMTDEMKRDLVWSRMRDVPTKLAYRESAGAEVGLRQAEEFARRVRETEGVEIAHIVCAHQHEARDGFGYLPFDKCFTGGLTCQCVCSFENKTPFDGIAQPTILRLNGAGMPRPIFPIKRNDACQK